MRLINADELIEVFRSLALMRSGEYRESFTNVDGNRSMEIVCAEDYVNKAKTIDAEPVKHARWVLCEDEYDDEYKCSACGRIQFFEMTPQMEGWEYCPHCGADMRGEQDDESRSNSNAQTNTRARGMGATDKSSGI